MQQNKKACLFPASIKDADIQKGIITGYFASFGTLDTDNDIIMPGAFDKSIQEMGPNSSKPRIKHYLNHDTEQPVGKLTLLRPQEDRLYYESKAGINNTAIDTVKMIYSELITEHSIGYSIVKKTVLNPDEDWQNQKTQLTELKLWEGSCLTAWGANMDTPLTGMKLKQKAATYMPLLIKAIRNGTFTDETFVILEKELLFLQAAIQSDYGTTEPELKEETTQPNDEDLISLTNANIKMRLALFTN